jgi:streptomycin 3"-kinase
VIVLLDQATLTALRSLRSTEHTGGVAEWSSVSMGESGAQVFRRVDGALVAKCVTPSGVDDLHEERRRIEWLAGTGIPGPSLVDWSTTSEGGAELVMTAVPGVPASELDSGALLRAWPSLVGMLRRLHELPVVGCPFERRLGTMFRLAEDVVRRDAVIPEFLAEEQQGRPATELLADLRAQLDERLAQEPHDLVVCHGDACLPNFMVDPETLTCTGLIDLGRLGTADRHADLSLLQANARETWELRDEARANQLLADLYGPDRIDPARMRFYLHLDPLTWS